MFGGAGGCLAASCMFAAASYLHNPGVFCVLAILATVIVIALNRAFAHTMRAFVIVCHTYTLLSQTMLSRRGPHHNRASLFS
jgi:hypothetical protein